MKKEIRNYAIKTATVITALAIVLGGQSAAAQEATDTPSQVSTGGSLNTPAFMSRPSLADQLPTQLIEDEVIFLGDKDIPLDYLKEYYNFYTNTLLPNVTKIFPDVSQLVDKPVFIVTRTADSAKNWAGNPDNAHGEYNGSYALLMEHHRDNIQSINSILIAHEFVHLLVDKVLTERRGAPKIIDEGLALNYSWMLYEKRDDWTSSISDRAWNEIANSSTPVPELWSHMEPDSWTVAAVSFLVKKYGIPKFIEFLGQTSQGGDSFNHAYGISRKQFQIEFIKEVHRLRELNGIQSPDDPLLTPEQPPREFNPSDVGIRLNGTYIELDPKAKILDDGSTYIPLRGVFEAMGARVTWTPEVNITSLSAITMERTTTTKPAKVTISKSGWGGAIVELTIGDTKAFINGKPATLSMAPFISEDGTTYVPLRFASEALNAKVSWEGDIYTAVIDTDY